MKIKVDFLFQWAPGWSNFESVIAALQKDGNFICRVLLLPFHNSGQQDPDNPQARAFLEARNIAWIWHEDDDYLTYRPDVVFVQNPYDFTRPERFSCRMLAQNRIRYAYIPYGLDVGEGETNLRFQYNMDCHNLASWIFVRSAQHKKLYREYCRAGNKHVHVTGHPKFDSVALWRKPPTQSGRKVLLWTPHFVEGEQTGWSTFVHYCDTLLYIAMTYPIELIVRPHPLFVPRLKAFGGQAVEMFSRLVNYAASCDNIRLDLDPSYDRAFAEADALLADAGSFLLEFLPTQKPILYLTHDTCLGLNKSASFVKKSYQVATNAQDIDDFVNMVIAGEDTHKEKRMAALRENFFVPPVSAGDEICQVLRRAFERRIARETRVVGDEEMKIDRQAVLTFFESRAQHSDRDNHLTMTMYQSAELAAQRDAHEKALILPLLALTADARLLDIGCGNGRWYGALREGSVRYTGVDFSPSLIAIAQEKYADCPASAFHVMKANDISPALVPPDSPGFTHVIISGVLIYLNNDEVTETFSRLAEITVPGAIIYLREPVAVRERLTLKGHWSAELNSHYSAIYRTPEALLALIAASDERLPFELLKADEMYPARFNNRTETQQRYFIFRRK